MTRQALRVLAAAVMTLATVLPLAPAAAQAIAACVNRNQQFSVNEQIQSCTEAIRSGRWRGKNLAWAYGNRCIAYKDKGQYGRAMVDCNQAIRLNPRNDHAYNTRGAIYHLEGKYNKAIQQYSTAIGLNPNFNDPVRNRELSYSARTEHARQFAGRAHARRTRHGRSRRTEGGDGL